MSNNARRRSVIIGVVVLVLLLVLLALLGRCRPQKPTPSGAGSDSPGVAAPPAGAGVPGAGVADTPLAPEVLTPATLTAPAQVPAGSAFMVAWTGPENLGDYVTIVKPDAPADVYTSFKEVQEGKELELTAPIEPGSYEVRYVAARSHTVLGRAPVEVEPVGATLEGPREVVRGSEFEVRWTGPDNQGDYVTIVVKGAADDHYGDFADTKHGSPARLTAPIDTGDAELRYVSGQGRKVLARRGITVIGASVTLEAAAEGVAGSEVAVTWTGPNNAGDYITVVPVGTPDGHYANYTNTSAGTPLELVLPIDAGPAEIRYMTGQGHKVLARRAIVVVAAEVTLSAPETCAPGAEVEIAWTGPNNRGDYITIVPKDARDGDYKDYANTTGGSPLKINAPAAAGEAEIRYMSGQGARVLARRVIRVGG